MYLILPVLTVALLVGALVDIITRDESRVRYLPKLVWILLVVLLPVVGSLVWFVVGRDWQREPEAIPFGDPRRHEAVVERAPRLRSTEEQLAALEEEIAQAEREERIRRLERELEAKRRPDADAR